MYDNQYEQLKEKLENGTLTQNDIKLKHSLSFDYALRDLKRKLFEKDERGNKNTSGFSVSDIIIEFNSSFRWKNYCCYCGGYSSKLSRECILLL